MNLTETAKKNDNDVFPEFSSIKPNFCVIKVDYILQSILVIVRVGFFLHT